MTEEVDGTCVWIVTLYATSSSVDQSFPDFAERMIPAIVERLVAFLRLKRTRTGKKVRVRIRRQETKTWVPLPLSHDSKHL